MIAIIRFGLVFAGVLLVSLCGKASPPATPTPTLAPSQSAAPTRPAIRTPRPTTTQTPGVTIVPTLTPAPSAAPYQGPVDSPNLSQAGGDELWVIQPDGGNARRITGGAGLWNFEWSPVQDLLAVTKWEHAGNQAAIEVYDSAGTLKTRIPTTGYTWLWWSPDGALLAYTSMPESGVMAVSVADPSSGQTREVARTDAGPGWIQPVGFLNDGRLLATLHAQAGGWEQFMAYPVQGGAPQELGGNSPNQYVSASAISPDGATLAYSATDPDLPPCEGQDQGGGNMVALIDVATNTSRRLAIDGCGFISLAWSDDGSKLAAGSLDGLYVADVAAGTAVRLTEGRTLVGGFTADHRVLFQKLSCWGCDGPAYGPFAIPETGGDAEQLADRGNVDVSPRSGRLLVTADDLREITAGGAHVIAVPQWGKDFRGGAWSPDESLVAVHIGTSVGITVSHVDATGRLIGAPEYSQSWGVFSPDRQWIAAQNQSGSVTLTRASDGASVPLEGVNVVVAWLPDSEHLLVAQMDGQPTSWYEADTSGNLRFIVQTSDVSIWDGALSPDGTKYLTPSLPLGSTVIVDMATGVLTRYPGGGDSYAWADDFVHFTYVSGSDVYVSDTVTGTARQITFSAGNEWAPSMSPDGSLLAYGSQGGLTITDISGPVPRQVFTLSGEFYMGVGDWSPDGTKYAVPGSSENGAGVFIIAADGSSATRITEGFVSKVDWRADGTLILVTEQGGL